MLQGRLTAQEAAAVAQLPLSPALDRLERIFEALNTVYCFLQMKNIQVEPSPGKSSLLKGTGFGISLMCLSMLPNGTTLAGCVLSWALPL